MRHWFIIPMPGIVCSSRAKQLFGLFTMHTVAVMRRMRNSVARLGTRYQLFFGSDPRSLGCNSDGDTRVAKRDIARRILPGLQQLERHALRYALEQPSAVTEEHRAHDELILIDETVLRQLRHDRSATEDHHVLAGPLLHGRALVHVQLTDEAEARMRRAEATLEVYRAAAPKRGLSRRAPRRPRVRGRRDRAAREWVLSSSTFTA